MYLRVNYDYYHVVKNIFQRLLILMDEIHTFIEIAITRETRESIGRSPKRIKIVGNCRKFLRPEFRECFHCVRRFIRPLLQARCIKIQRVVTRARFIDS